MGRFVRAWGWVLVVVALLAGLGAVAQAQEEEGASSTAPSGPPSPTPFGPGVETMIVDAGALRDGTPYVSVLLLQGGKPVGLVVLVDTLAIRVLLPVLVPGWQMQEPSDEPPTPEGPEGSPSSVPPGDPDVRGHTG